MEEFQNFIGIILLSGFNSRSNSHMYCETDPLVNCPAVSMTMSRNRFMEIKSALHAANNDILLKTRMAKVSPLYNILNEGLLQYGVFHEELSVDECMIPYYGHHSCKQYIRGKPIRFGYKCWITASASGYPYSCLLYTSPSPRDLSTSRMPSSA